MGTSSSICRWMSLLFACIAWFNPLSAADLEFFFVIPSFNNNKFDKQGINWIEKNLESVFVQTYPNWTLCYVNDCSTDGTGAVAEAYAQRRGMYDKCQFIHNPKNRGALANLYSAISNCPPHKIVVLLDGDDSLANSKVLARVAKEYHNHDAWMTYGSYICVPGGIRGRRGKQIPTKIMKQCQFRKYNFVTSHLRTFYAKLFQNIKKDDLRYKGAFYRGGWDLAILFPMLEMASRGHIRFIKDILYHYNCTNPISDARIHTHEQRVANITVRARKPYKPLHRLFSKPTAEVATAVK